MEYRLRYSDPGNEIVVTEASALPRIGEAMKIDQQEYRVLSVTHAIEGTQARHPIVEVVPAGERTD